MLRKKIANTFIIIAIVAAIRAIYVIALGRILPKQSMGLVSFFISSADFVCGIALLGQHTALTRFFSNNSPGDYNWKRWLKNLLTINSVIIIISGFVIYKFYHILFSYSALFILTVFSLVTISIYAGLLRSQIAVEKAILFKSLPNIIFAALLVLGMIFLRFTTAGSAIIYYTVSAIISACYIFKHSSVNIKHGSLPIPKSAYIDGAILFVSSMSMYVLTTSDRLFIAKMLSFEELAIYSVTFSIMIIYNLGAETLWFVMMPYFAKAKSIDFRKIYAYLFMIACAVSLFYMLFADKILAILFKDKYNDGIFLVPYFMVIGIIRLFNQIPSSLIAGRLKQRYLKVFLFITIVTFIFNFILNYYFISLWKLRGAAMASIVCWSVYFIGGMAIVIKGLRSENNISKIEQ